MEKSILNRIADIVSLFKDKDGKLLFFGDEVVLFTESASVLIKTETDIKLGFPIKEFLSVVKHLEEGEVKIKSSNNKLSLVSGRNKATLSAFDITDEDQENYRHFRASFPKNLKKIPADFFDGIRLCALKPVIKSLNPITTSVVIKGNKILSTDDFRISEYELSEDMGNFILPSANALILEKIPGMEKYVAIEQSVFFEGNRVLLQLPTINEEFPDILKFFNFEGIKIRLPFDLVASSVKKIMSMAEDEKYITVRIENGTVSLIGEKREASLETSFDVDYKGKKIEFLINPKFLLDASLVAKSVVIGEKKVRFTARKFKQVVALYN